MSSTRRERPTWEYAEGSEVGRDVPVTSEPREEIAPGVPRPPRPTSSGSRSGPSAGETRAGTEVREVVAEDPELSAATNRRLTEELRDVVGTDRVRVASDRPHATRGERLPHATVGGFLAMHRLQLIGTTAIMLTFGAVVSLITNDWWLLPLAAGVHALGTMTVVLTVVGMTTITEHPSPDVAAALADDGVVSPDERFSRMVDEFRSRDQAGAAEVLSPGENERTADAISDTPEAAAEQSSSMTPTGTPSRPGGQGGAPDLLIWVTTGSLFVLSIVLPAVMGGGWLWLLTAVMVPLLAGWVLVQRMMIQSPDRLRTDSRGPLVGIALCTAVAVAVFCAVVALAFQH